MASGEFGDAEEELVRVGVVFCGEKGVKVSGGWRGSIGPDGVDDGLAKGLFSPGRASWREETVKRRPQVPPQAVKESRWRSSRAFLRAGAPVALDRVLIAA